MSALSSAPSSPHCLIPAVTVAARKERDIHVLLWQVRGSAEVATDGLRRTLDVGHALWIPVGTPHGFTVQEDSVSLPLFFGARGSPGALSEVTLLGVDDDLRTLLLAYSVSSYSIIQPPADLAGQVLSRLASSPMVSACLPMPRLGPAHLIASWLLSDPGDPRGVSELAAAAHTTPKTVERAFRAASDLTFREWRVRLRVEAAAHLLRAGNHVSVVAHRVGYTNVNSFRRAFTVHFGVTPTVFSARFGPVPSIARQASFP